MTEKRGVKLLGLGMGVAQVCALARYVILARLLGPAELGAAAAIILTAQFFDSIFDSGSDRFLIQDRDGDEPRAQAMVQLFAALRGSFVGLLIALTGGLVATWFGMREAALGFACVGLVPFFNGLNHLDMRRTQRAHDFRIEGAAIFISETLGIIATIIGALILRDHMAAVVGLMARSATIMAVSHIMAARRFRLAFDGDVARRLARFSLPLMLNGLLLFLGSQSDRLLIGRYLGLEELGRYSTILLLIYYPTAMVQRFIGGLFLPRMVVTNPHRAEAMAELRVLAVAAGAALMLGFALVGPVAVPILFGARYTPDISVVAIVGLLNAARFVRLWPTTSALALGASDQVLGGNLVRLAGLPLGIVCYLWSPHIEWMLFGFVMGEMLALVCALWWLNRREGLAGSAAFGLVGWFAALAIGMVATAESVEFSQWMSVCVAAGLSAGLIALFLWRERRVISIIARDFASHFKGLRKAA